MRVHDSGVCLVAAHLSSGQAEGDELRRNYDYAEVPTQLFPALQTFPEGLRDLHTRFGRQQSCVHIDPEPAAKNCCASCEYAGCGP